MTANQWACFFSYIYHKVGAAVDFWLYRLDECFDSFFEDSPLSEQIAGVLLAIAIGSCLAMALITWALL